jgi:hypothetical protein
MQAMSQMDHSRQFDDVRHMSGQRPDSDMLFGCDRVGYAGRFSVTRSDCGPGVPISLGPSAQAVAIDKKRCKIRSLSQTSLAQFQLRRATLYPAELRVRGVHLADWRCVGNGPCRGWGGVTSEARKATVIRSNRVGCARKAGAERAGTVAGHFLIDVAGDGSFAHRVPRCANEPGSIQRT